MKPVDRSIPPKDCDKRLLFRELIRRPRAQRALKTRIRGAQHVQLYVRALKSLEYAIVFETSDDPQLKQLGVSAISLEILSSSVFTRSQRAFASAEQVAMLSTDEINVLIKEVLEALHFISPTYQGSDIGAWNIALKEGASHPSNFQEALLMYRSCDRVGMDATVYERPDRYFGLPMCELTDGQLMVFSAAVQYVTAAVRSPDG